MSWYDEMVAAGRSKSLTTGNIRCWVAAVHEVLGSPALETPVTYGIVTLCCDVFSPKSEAYTVRLLSNGVGTNFGVHGGRRGEAGDDVLGEGQPAHPHQLGDLRERCKLPQRGPMGFLVF